MHVQTGDGSRVPLLHKHNESHLALSSDRCRQAGKPIVFLKTTDMCASYQFKQFLKAHLKPKKKSSHFVRVLINRVETKSMHSESD